VDQKIMYWKFVELRMTGKAAVSESMATSD